MSPTWTSPPRTSPSARPELIPSPSSTSGWRESVKSVYWSTKHHHEWHHHYHQRGKYEFSCGIPVFQTRTLFLIHLSIKQTWTKFQWNSVTRVQSVNTDICNTEQEQDIRHSRSENVLHFQSEDIRHEDVRHQDIQHQDVCQEDVRHQDIHQVWQDVQQACPPAQDPPDVQFSSTLLILNILCLMSTPIPCPVWWKDKEVTRQSWCNREGPGPI